MNTHLKIQQVLQGGQHPHIAVMRSLPGLGDLLCCVPALRALRCAWPGAHIAFIGLPSAVPFVQRFSHYVDELLEFPGFPGIPEVSGNPAKLEVFLAAAHSRKFDLALQLHGNGSCTNAFIQLLGARLNAGFYPLQSDCPDANYFLPYPVHGAEIWRLLTLLEFLGVSLQGAQLEFPLTTADWQDWHAIAATYPVSTAYVCVHPGASVAARRCPPHDFAQIADQLVALGLQVVLTGSAAERSLTESVAAHMQASAINLAGVTSLGALAILLQGAKLLVCNDTGVSHLAAALGVKSVVIFSDSDPHRWAPLNRDLHRVVQVPRSERSQIESPLKPSRLVQQVVTEGLNLLDLEFSYAS